MVVMESFHKKRRVVSSLKEVEDDTNNGSCSIPEKDEDDKLSSLPDSLLITIISLLPINVAAATSLLSRRWRNLWAHTTHLSVSLNCDDFQCFVTTVNHIISQLKSPKIHTFDLSLPRELSWYIIYGTQVSSDFMVPWLHQICLRDPEVIDLNFAVHPLSTNFLQIPHCLFETQSLVELRLFANIEFNFLHDRMSSIKFPNLKKLALVLYDRDCALLGRKGTLFKACPLLEDLTLSLIFTKVDLILHISIPNLKCLRIDITRDLEDCQFVIDSPKLEKCNIVGDLMFYKFVDNPSSLQEVKISIEESSLAGDSDYINKIPGLIRGISCVRSLVLENSATYLLPSISELEALPILKNLTHFSFSYHDCIDELPGCLLSGNSLKRVDIRDLECDDAEINLVQHILSNADALEQLHVSASDCFYYEDQLRTEYEFCKKLFMLSKSSVNCQVEFSGTVIIASSKDFGDDGVLSCQIKNHIFAPRYSLSQGHIFSALW